MVSLRHKQNDVFFLKLPLKTKLATYPDLQKKNTIFETCLYYILLEQPPSHIRKTLALRASGNRTYILPSSKPQGAPTWIQSQGPNYCSCKSTKQNPQKLRTGIPVPWPLTSQLAHRNTGTNLHPTISHECLPSTAHSHAQLLARQGQTGNRIESKSWKNMASLVFQNIHSIVEIGTPCLSITGFQGRFPAAKLWAQITET